MNTKRARKYPKMKVCNTVGELITQLERLPKSMALDPIADGLVPVVFNIGRPDEQLCLEDNDGCWDDEVEHDFDSEEEED